MTRFLATALMLAALLAGGAVVAGPVNVNTADATTLARELDGVGLAKAKAIVEWRRANGRFTSLQQLQQVKGIGARTIELNKSNIRFAEADESKQ